MSQGDYLKRKQVAQVLRADGLSSPTHFPAVFSSHDLLKYKQYQIVNDDSNTKLNYNLITPPNKKIVFDMERDVTGCPTFIVCKDTQTRPNRALRPEADCHVKIRPLTWQDIKNRPNSKRNCHCELKNKHINRSFCDCGITPVEKPN